MGRHMHASETKVTGAVREVGKLKVVALGVIRGIIDMYCFLMSHSGLAYVLVRMNQHDRSRCTVICSPRMSKHVSLKHPKLPSPGSFVSKSPQWFELSWSSCEQTGTCKNI